eukprot:6192437-Pleurochrysis_carterae.AAC.1
MAASPLCTHPPSPRLVLGLDADVSAHAARLASSSEDVCSHADGKTCEPRAHATTMPDTRAQVPTHARTHRFSRDCLHAHTQMRACPILLRTRSHLACMAFQMLALLPSAVPDAQRALFLRVLAKLAENAPDQAAYALSAAFTNIARSLFMIDTTFSLCASESRSLASLRSLVVPIIRAADGASPEVRQTDLSRRRVLRACAAVRAHAHACA